MEDGGGWGGVTLAHGGGSPAAVDAVLGGGRSGGCRHRPARRDDVLGRLLGIFIDPDGHPWEVAHNPGLLLAEDGGVHLPADGVGAARPAGPCRSANHLRRRGEPCRSMWRDIPRHCSPTGVVSVDGGSHCAAQSRPDRFAM